MLQVRILLPSPYEGIAQLVEQRIKKRPVYIAVWRSQFNSPGSLSGERRGGAVPPQPSEGTAIKCQNLTNGGNCL